MQVDLFHFNCESLCSSRVISSAWTLTDRTACNMFKKSPTHVSYAVGQQGHTIFEFGRQVFHSAAIQVPTALTKPTPSSPLRTSRASVSGAAGQYKSSWMQLRPGLHGCPGTHQLRALPGPGERGRPGSHQSNCWATSIPSREPFACPKPLIGCMGQVLRPYHIVNRILPSCAAYHYTKQVSAWTMLNVVRCVTQIKKKSFRLKIATCARQHHVLNDGGRACCAEAR